ncbi:DMT family transporter [Amycolatopsis minnesotensis]
MILLAVASAGAYGIADFLGGTASRKANVFRVVAISAPASLLVEVLLLPLLGARWNAGSLGWGAVSGIASAFAFALFYYALASGPMTIMAPITAVVSAALPVLVGLVAGERLSAAGIAGLPVAVCAIVLVTVKRDFAVAVVSRRAVVVAFLAGAAIALQLIMLHQAPHDSGVAPLIVGRTVSSLILLGAVVAMRRRIGSGRPPIVLAAAAGCLDSLANLFFLLASRAGLLSVSAAIVALYPVATVVLARVMIKEQIRGVQWLGLTTAVVGVVLLSQT